MCFGNQTQTEQKTTTTTPAAYIQGPSMQNVARASTLAATPATPYAAPFAAPYSPDEQTGTQMLRTAAGSANPYTSTIQNLYGKFANAPANTVAAPSMLGPGANVSTASLSDYISPYVNAALQPVLQGVDTQRIANQKQLDSSAIMSGAFGDARAGVEAAKNNYYTDLAKSNAIGQAYNTAFNTAAGLRQNDITNSLNVQNQNNQNRETALQRAIAGGQALQNLDQYDTGRTVNLATALNQAGATQRGVAQNDLNAQYQEFLRQQGWTPQMIQLMSSVLSSAPRDNTTAATTMQPDNSGYGILGSVLGAGASVALAPFTGGMSLMGLPAAMGSMSNNVGALNYGAGGPFGGGSSRNAIY